MRGFPGQRSSLLAFRHPTTDSRSQVMPQRGSEEARHHLSRLRTLADAWCCRIAVRVGGGTSYSESLLPRCIARTTTTSRMRNPATAGPAESPYTRLGERYPLPALPDQLGLHACSSNACLIASENNRLDIRLDIRLAIPPLSIVRLGTVV